MSSKRALKREDITSFLNETILEEEVFYTKDKPQSNLNQSEIKVKPETSTKPQSNLNQSEIKKSETSTKVQAQLKPQPQSNLNQSEIKGLKSIVGLQRDILDILIQYCMNNGSTNTGNIFVDEIAQKVSTTSPTVRTAIQRLEKKGCIIRSSFKNGRGGFSIYEIPSDIYQEWILNSKVKPNLNQSEIKVQAQLKPQLKPEPTNSSSDLKDINISTSIQIPENLKTMISKREIQKLLDKDLLTEDDLIKSLEHFSYDLENNLVRAKTSPLNLFFGLIRSGQTYKSLKLLDLENKELQEYQIQLQKIEEENKKLKESEFKEKYNFFKQNNPGFIEAIKDDQKFNLSTEVLDEIGFSKFIEQTTRGHKNDF